MGAVADDRSGMNETRNRMYRRANLFGWVASIIGLGLWSYGLFADEEMLAILDWPSFTPQWIASAFPNWLCELGLVLSAIGSAPLYYVQIRERQTG